MLLSSSNVNRSNNYNSNKTTIRISRTTTVTAPIRKTTIRKTATTARKIITLMLETTAAITK